MTSWRMRLAMPRRLGVVLVILSVASVVACTGGGYGDGQSDDDTDTDNVVVPVLDSAPDFTMSAYTGEDRLGSSRFPRFSELAGIPVILNFWAALCPPCTAEMPDLQEFYDEFEDKVIVLGVDVGRYTGLGERTDALILLDSLGITYPTAFDIDGTTVGNYAVLNMPSTFFITAKSEIFRKWTGVINKKSLVKITEEMLARDAGSTS